MNQQEAVSPRGLANNLYNNYAILRARIERAVELYKNNCVESLGEAKFEVAGNAEIYQITLSLGGCSCTCPDHEKAPGGLCKHILSACLYQAAHVELPARKLPTVIRLAKRLPKF